MVSQPIANMAAFLAVRLAQRRNVRERRVFGERMLIAGMRDIDFISKYRLDRTGVEDLLQLVGNDLVKEDRGGHAIPPETQLLASLRFLSKGAFYSEIADSHGVSKSSISRFMPKVVESLNTHLDNIKFPTERDELLTTKREFFAKCHFPNIGGAIDGTLIPIVAPTRDEEAFVCRKGFHAINCQAVVGPDLSLYPIQAIIKVLKSGFVRVVFRIKTLSSFNPTTDTVCIIIEKGTFAMGSETLRTSFIGGDMWLIETYLLKSAVIRYKLAMFSHISNDFSDKENFWRVMQTASGHPILIELTYNTETETSREMKSNLTTSGEAFNIHVPVPAREQNDQSQTVDGATEGAKPSPIGQEFLKDGAVGFRKETVLEITQCGYKSLTHRRLIIFIAVSVVMILCLMALCVWIGTEVAC